ncbi:MAG TPA: ATP-dependent helicase, partial [Nitrospirota bacterium]|nr:ATP-dependent helicase [Nitrospirota bacterium]
VINYDIPDTTDAYTHRIGRTGRAAKTGDAFTFVTHEDEPVVRSIERVLGEKIERRTIKDFDYKKTAPVRDTEFARPPREPRRRPEAGRPEQGRAHASHAGHGSRGTTSQAMPGGHRGAAGAHSPGKRTFKPRAHRP